ncbi:MAG: MFS transporter [Myxococcota bacterium]
MREVRGAVRVLTMNTLAFTVSFAVWMMNGVLVTYLVDNRVYVFDKAQMGWLMGLPVLTGSILRLPAGVLTDRYGGRPVFAALMLISAASCWLVSYADTFAEFALGSLGFGVCGATFAVGIAYTSVWFPSRLQGTALGIFGVGNAGAAVTSLAAPHLLRYLTQGGTFLDGWRYLPRLYGLALVVMTIAFWLLTTNRRVDHAAGHSLGQRLEPLRHARVWRFGLYYFLVFGAFVALAQWLIPYYVNVYATSVATAGLLASIFSLPSGVIRALGGVLSDKLGARRVMYWVLGGCIATAALLIVPRMEIYAAGEGVMAAAGGVVSRVTGDEIVVGERAYALAPQPGTVDFDAEPLVWPTTASWQEPIVKPGDAVQKKQLLARGRTHIYFQANMWVFTFLVFVMGILMGIGKAAVYKYIPDYFPQQVGVVGGIVGVLGGLGGFVAPILFGYMLRGTGLWTSCWMFLALLSVGCLVWLHRTVRRLTIERAPQIAYHIDHEFITVPAGEVVS